MLNRRQTRTGPVLAGIAGAALALTGCTGSGDTPEKAQPSPSQRQAEPAGVAAPDPEDRTLLAQVDDQSGSSTIEGVSTDAEAVAFAVACDRPGTLTINMSAGLGYVTLSCAPDSGRSRLAVDVRDAEAPMDFTVSASEDLRWALTVTETEMGLPGGS